MPACICADKLQFLNPKYGRIVTGDLDVVDDVNLTILMSYGPIFPWERVKTNLSISIKAHVHKLSSKFNRDLIAKVKINRDDLYN